jgi:myo-inositol-1(or 4)-monophosphatase
MDFSFLTIQAIEAAKEAASYIKSQFGLIHTVEEKEGKHNIVTECDKQSEEMIISHLRKQFPSHGFLAEERGEQNRSTEMLWVIDPLDGTVNFFRGIPHFAISIAACQGTDIVLGVIMHPLTGECFVAEKGKGAFHNNKRLHVSSTEHIDAALIATGFPYNVDENPMQCIESISYFLHRGNHIRRMGAASLDLAYIAAGHFDAYFETNLKPWDVAAGILLVEEAQGKISRWDGSSHPVLRFS